MRKTLLTFSTDSWSLALKCKEIDEPVSRVEIIVKKLPKIQQHLCQPTKFKSSL